MEFEDRIAAQFTANQETVRASLDALLAPIAETGRVILECLERGGKLIAFGNGGSAAQADHLVGELVGRYRQNRRPLPAIALPASSGTVTCISNDYSFDDVFARQVEALASKDDVLVGMTTSGTSANVLAGLRQGRDQGAATIMLTGSGSLVSASADHILAVPSASTARIQEVHLLVIHSWCELIDETFAG